MAKDLEANLENRKPYGAIAAFIVLGVLCLLGAVTSMTLPIWAAIYSIKYNLFFFLFIALPFAAILAVGGIASIFRADHLKYDHKLQHQLHEIRDKHKNPQEEQRSLHDSQNQPSPSPKEPNASPSPSVTLFQKQNADSTKPESENEPRNTASMV